MNPNVRFRTAAPRKLGLLAVGLAALAFSTQARASTASNTQISNTATVNFNDAGGAAQTPVTSAAAVITVQLVASAPNINTPANISVSQGGANGTLTYTITGTANGPDTYNLAAGDTQTNLTGGSATFPGGTSITLNATTLAAAAPIGATTITVPYDQVASTASINGLTPGSTIVIGGNTYVIAAGGINKTNSATTNTVVITLTTAIAGTAGVAGQVVPEQKTFTVSVAPGTVTTGGSGTQGITVTATSTADNTKTGTSGTTTVTTNRPTLTVTKLVSTDNGATFVAAANAPPGTSLIYKITATNTGSTNATQVSFTDVVPLFLTYQNGTGKFATSTATTYSGATTLTEGSGGYSYTAGTQTVAYNPGGATGTVAGSNGVLILFFRATIN
ncbi:MAG: hypothetical protein JST92_12330 [Deltaproteobacteria bacterium]|nr:hypothetical protein [Deltaproteobacteria bacterium]